MLQPKKVKYRRIQKGRMKGNAQRGAEVSFGSYGLNLLSLYSLLLARSRQHVLLCLVMKEKENSGFVFFR